MAEKLVIHEVGADKKTFKDISAQVGDVSKLSAPDLAKKLADYAKKNNLSATNVVAEVVM